MYAEFDWNWCPRFVPVAVMQMTIAWALIALPFVLLYWLLTIDHKANDNHDFGLEDVHTWLAEKRWLYTQPRVVNRRSPKPVLCFPATVTRLAEAAAAGEDCDFALHDALLEAGRPELAVYFSGPRTPASGWAIDQILGQR
jgi:hypothetical protein